MEGEWACCELGMCRHNIKFHTLLFVLTSSAKPMYQVHAHIARRNSDEVTFQPRHPLPHAPSPFLLPPSPIPPSPDPLKVIKKCCKRGGPGGERYLGLIFRIRKLHVTLQNSILVRIVPRCPFFLFGFLSFRLSVFFNFVLCALRNCFFALFQAAQ